KGVRSKVELMHARFFAALRMTSTEKQMIQGEKQMRMVRPERFELPTFWFVARRSIQLSYGRASRTVFSCYQTPGGRATAPLPTCRWSEFLRAGLHRFLLHARRETIAVSKPLRPHPD